MSVKFNINPSDELGGAGFFDFIKKGADVLSRGNNFLKSSRAISKVSGAAGDIFGNKTLSNFSKKAYQYGYGPMMTNDDAMVTEPVIATKVVVKRRGRKPGPKKGNGGRPKKVGRPKK